ncbi:MAG: hypothetical protein NVS9B15_01650 [Acidobacteriaceae bacterium]
MHVAEGHVAPEFNAEGTRKAGALPSHVNWDESSNEDCEQREGEREVAARARHR